MDRHHDVAVLALARDCARTVPAFLQWIDELDAGGVSTFVLVGENGSRDDTRGLLSRAQAAGVLRLEDTGFMRDLPRLRRMAEGRQHMAARLAEARVAPRAVCVLDLDEPMSSPPRVEAFRAALARLLAADDLFAVASTSSPTYYDLLAFDDGQIAFDHLLDDIRAAETDPFTYYRLFADRIYPQQWRLTSPLEIRCVSAFNGLCLYRYGDYARGSYTAGSDFRVCEHLTFNRSIAAATGRAMVIDPTLAVRTPVEHGRRSFPMFWAQRALKGVRRLMA